MPDDAEYLPNYRTNELYINTAKDGAFATIVTEGDDTLIGEFSLAPRCKIAVKAFYVRDKADFNSFKIVKLKWTKADGWREDGSVHVNHFQAARMAELVALLSHLNLTEATKARMSLENVNVGDLSALLSSSKGAAVVRELAESPQLHHDIYAVAAKRAAVAEFEGMLGKSLKEAEWQAYFERHPWVFGHGLNYVFLDKVGDKLETRTTGAAHGQAGKTADGLMRTRAEISQYVLIEIKRDATALLQDDKYRSGCWAVSAELSAAVTQAQKTAHDFAHNRFRDPLTDRDGNETGEVVYSIEPRSYLVVGNTTELRYNGDKIACFELYRRNIRSPEILTFDELFERARCIVDNLSGDASAPSKGKPDAPSPASQANPFEYEDDIPF
ncbi:MAG: Shedu immune nuclease family protein [Croceibacterium sp.]